MGSYQLSQRSHRLLATLVREYIETGEADGKSLLDAMRDGKLDGMQDFDSVIKAMIENNTVSIQDGLTFATNPNNLLLSLKGVTGGEEYLQRGNNNVMPIRPTSDTGSMLSMLE